MMLRRQLAWFGSIRWLGGEGGGKIYEMTMR